MQHRTVDILALRHGQSEWNAVRRWQGAADIPLTDLGRTQARQTGERLRDLDRAWSGVWSSTLVRAGETAAIIADALALGEVDADARLREAHAGEWQGMTPDEIEVRYPGWLDAHRRPDTFEPYDEVVARGSAGFCAVADASAARGSGTALVVSHSGLIRTVIRSHGYDDSRIPNLGGVWLTVDLDGSATVANAADRITIGDLFDPGNIVVSGVDMPGEDPGEKPEHAEHDGAAEHELSRGALLEPSGDEV